MSNYTFCFCFFAAVDKRRKSVVCVVYALKSQVLRFNFRFGERGGEPKSQITAQRTHTEIGNGAGEEELALLYCCSKKSLWGNCREKISC